MKLPIPKTKHAATLYHLLINKRMTSVELARKTNVGYSPRKIQMIEERGVKVLHDLVPYVTSEGRKTMVARYTLTDINQARKIYKKLVA